MAAINFEEEERLRNLLLRPEDELGTQPLALPAPAPEAKPVPPVAIAAPSATPDANVGGAMPAISTPKVPTKLEQDQNEVARLRKSGSGIDQIMHPVDASGNPDTSKHPGKLKRIGSIAARIGDVVGSALFPTVMMNIPGTTYHHQMLENQAEGNVQEDLENDKTEAESYAKLHPRDANPSEFSKWLEQNPNKTVEDYWRARTNDKNRATLASKGFKLDDTTGNIVPDPDSPITKTNAAKDAYLETQMQLAKANIELKGAQAEVERSKNDPNSPAYKLAIQKLQVAQMNAQTMELMGKSRWANYLMHAKGVDMEGNVLSGAMLDEEGGAVGSTFSQNVRPTGTERGKADMATSAKDQISDMKEIVKRRQDIFGPVAGRTTDFTVWMGSQDPDAQRIRAARTIAGDHLAGTFGGRSEAALTALDNALGSFKDNPEAVFAGLDQIEKANDSFIKWGTVRTEGSKDSKGAVRRAKVGTKGGASAGTGKAVSLSQARSLPQNKGKSDAEIRKDIEAHGHKVVD